MASSGQEDTHNPHPIHRSLNDGHIVFHLNGTHLAPFEAGLAARACLRVHQGIVVRMGYGRRIIVFIDMGQGLAATTAAVADEDLVVFGV